MTVIFSSHQATLPELHQLGGAAARVLYSTASHAGLLPTGPVYWLYYGMDGKPGTVFTLDVALPIAGDTKAVEHASIKQVPQFICFSAIHRGDWGKLSITYEKAMQIMQQELLRPNGLFREVYLNADFVKKENNLTEIQIGV